MCCNRTLCIWTCFLRHFRAKQTLSRSLMSQRLLLHLSGRLPRPASPYDRYHYGGDDQAISESAKRGEVLFFSEPLSCFRCHGGFNFSDATDFEGRRGGEVQFHNTGLYNIAGAISYSQPDVGIYEYTSKPEDVGKFKVPTLRNVALTAPYMHDGSAKTLDAVLDHYSAGGRTIVGSPNAGEESSQSEQGPLNSRLPIVGRGPSGPDRVFGIFDRR